MCRGTHKSIQGELDHYSISSHFHADDLFMHTQICDRDNDQVLNDQELNDFQVYTAYPYF